MIVRVHLYGMLKELIGNTVELEVNAPLTGDIIISTFKIKFPQFNKTAFLIAVDHTLCSPNMEISSFNHIALLPPVSGG
ncbi:MAG: MoaD/ThiS family protein [Bacteroidota bacterium]